MVSNTKFSLHQLTQNIKIDLDIAKENAKLSQDVECFQNQKDFWDGKVEAFEHVVTTLERASAIVQGFENKKDKVVARFKLKFMP